MKNLKPKEIRIRALYIIVAGLLVALFGVARERNAFCVIGLLIMFASVIYHIVFYRCPHCGRYLGRVTGDFCPYCGKGFYETEPENTVEKSISAPKE